MINRERRSQLYQFIILELAIQSIQRDYKGIETLQHYLLVTLFTHVENVQCFF